MLLLMLFRSTNYFEDDAFFYDQSSFKMTSLPPDDVKKYWEQVQSIFAKDREQLWNALTVGLSKYFKILKGIDLDLLELNLPLCRLKLDFQ